MLKNILNLEGAQKLTKNEQKSITGGIKTGGGGGTFCVIPAEVEGNLLCPTGYYLKCPQFPVVGNCDCCPIAG